MKRVLVVAYQFPPVGGSGVQRTLKFVKYLPGTGWIPEVLTRDAGRMGQRDDTLLAEVPKDVPVMRTPARDLTVLPWKFALVGKFIAWKLLIPDGEILWMRGAVKAARKRVGSGRHRCGLHNLLPLYRSPHRSRIEAGIPGHSLGG